VLQCWLRQCEEPDEELWPILWTERPTGAGVMGDWFTLAMGEGLFCLTVKEISTHQYLKKNILQYKFLCYLLEPPIEIWLIFFIFFFEFWLLKIPQKT
jgi:hypothetical protein